MDGEALKNGCSRVQRDGRVCGHTLFDDVQAGVLHKIHQLCAARLGPGLWRSDEGVLTRRDTRDLVYKKESLRRLGTCQRCCG